MNKFLILVLLFSQPVYPYNMDAPQSPNLKKTPGHVLTTDVNKICKSGYTQTVRNVSSTMKRKVYDSYGIRFRQPGEYEIDHDICLCIGGSNDKRNLWPQSYKTKPYNAFMKDRLEVRMRDMVCNEGFPIEQAQKEMAEDWITAYHKYVTKDYTE